MDNNKWLCCTKSRQFKMQSIVVHESNINMTITFSQVRSGTESKNSWISRFCSRPCGLAYLPWQGNRNSFGKIKVDKR